jgi:hypothetical protein
MAYGAVQWTETTVASGTGFSIVVKHGYSQNPNTNKSYRYVAWMKLKANSSLYSIWNQTGSAQAGIRTTGSVFGPESWSFYVQKGSYDTYDPGDAKSSEFSHNADGSVTSPPSVGWYLNHNISDGYNGYSSSYYPSYTMTSWQYFTPTLPALSRTQPASTSTVSSISHSTCTLNFSGTCSSYNSISQYKYRINSGSDVTTTSTSVNLSGLSAGTSYTIHTWVKDNWGWWSQDKSLTFTTLTSGSSTTTTNGWPMIKVNGIWRNVTTPYIKVSGAQKAATKVYVKVGGTWKACK